MDVFIECGWCGVAVMLGYIEDEGSITPRASLEEERIKKNLSEGEKVSSFLVKRMCFIGESTFSPFFM